MQLEIVVDKIEKLEIFELLLPPCTVEVLARW